MQLLFWKLQFGAYLIPFHLKLKGGSWFGLFLLHPYIISFFYEIMYFHYEDYGLSDSKSFPIKIRVLYFGVYNSKLFIFNVLNILNYIIQNILLNYIIEVIFFTFKLVNLFFFSLLDSIIFSFFFHFQIHLEVKE